jgi:hypothetical protein
MTRMSKEKGNTDAQGNNHDHDRHHPRGGLPLNLLGGTTVMLCMTVYALHRTIMPMDDSWVAHAHLHDVMAMPILLGWIDLITDHRSPTARLFGDWRFSIVLTIACSAWWEVAMPLIDPTSWADWGDAACYAAGAAAYLAARAVVVARRGTEVF